MIPVRVSKVLFMVMAVIVMAACAGTKAAYQEAEGIYENAIVLGHHFKALQTEAVRIGATATFDEKELIKGANRRASPIIVELLETAQEYKAIQGEIAAGVDADARLQYVSVNLQSLIARASYALTGLFDAIRGAT